MRRYPLSNDQIIELAALEPVIKEKKSRVRKAGVFSAHICFLFYSVILCKGTCVYLPVESLQKACGIVVDEAELDEEVAAVPAELDEDEEDRLLQEQYEELRNHALNPETKNMKYCICNQEYDFEGNNMIYCDTCHSWYHGECVHVDVKVYKYNKWKCHKCRNMSFPSKPTSYI